ncbi:uncharacterized protein LOC128930724 isoform X1 [Callithrix jacchus]
MMVEDETGLSGFSGFARPAAPVLGFSGFAHPAAPCHEKEELSAACWRLEPVAPRLALLQWVAATETAECWREARPAWRREVSRGGSGGPGSAQPQGSQRRQRQRSQSFSGFAHPAAPCHEKEELSAACWRLEPVAPRLASLQWVAVTDCRVPERYADELFHVDPTQPFLGAGARSEVASVCSGCLAKLLKLGGFNRRNSLSQSGGWKSKSRCLQSWVLLRL